MKRTDSYQLNQWEKSDRILMEDFNGDNLKIDSALKGQAEGLAAETAARQALANSVRLQTISSQSFSTASTSLKVSLAGINWSSFRCVHMLVNVKLTDNTQYHAYLDADASCTLAFRCLSPLHVVFWPLCDSGRTVDGVAHGGSGFFTSSSLTYRNITTLSMLVQTSGGLFLSGTNVILYGERN